MLNRRRTANNATQFDPNPSIRVDEHADIGLARVEGDHMIAASVLINGFLKFLRLA